MRKLSLVDVIMSSKGKFFSVLFVKKNGEERLLNGRIGVVGKLKGGKSSVNYDKFLSVYDVQIGGYRSVNKETIKEVKFGGKVFKK